MAYYTAYSEQMKEGEVEGVAVMFVPLVPFVTLVPLVPLGQSLHKHLPKYLCPTICHYRQWTRSMVPTARPSCHYKMWIIVS